MDFKAPRIAHTVADLLLGLALHMEYPNVVRNKIDIFMFPDLSLM